MIRAYKNRRYSELLKKHLQEKSHLNKPETNHGKTIGLIYTDQEILGSLDHWVFTLRKQARQVHTLQYITTKLTKKDLPDLPGNAFCNLQLSSVGWIEAPVITDFESRVYDLLICVASKDMAVLHQVLSRTSSYLKIASEHYVNEADLIVEYGQHLSTTDYIHEIEDRLYLLSRKV